MNLNVLLGTDEHGREVTQLVVTLPPIDTRQLLRMIRAEQPNAWRDVEREIIVPNKTTPAANGVPKIINPENS
jgi:hypothetical protein